jgi:hypothetical protein
MVKNHSRPNRACTEPRLEQMNFNLMLALHWLLIEKRHACGGPPWRDAIGDEPELRPTPRVV